MVFATYYVLDPGTQMWVRLAMLLLSFPVAWLSWRYVEQPFRHPSASVTRRTYFMRTGLACALLAMCGGVIHALGGVPERFPVAVRRLADAVVVPDYACANRPLAEVKGDVSCRLGDPHVPPSFILWGDSHASVYDRALGARALAHGVSGYTITAFGCRPLHLNLDLRDQPVKAVKQAKCRKRNQEVLDFIVGLRPRAVLLAAYWNPQASKKHAAPIFTNGDKAMFEAGVKRLRAHGIEVYLALDVPARPSAAGRPEFAKAYLLGQVVDGTISLATHHRQTAAMRAFGASLERQGLVYLLDPARLLCEGQVCHMIRNGYQIYFDSNHLNTRGAAIASAAFEPMLRRLARP
jgi:hypothetical protein